jgi:isoleucyl-tRNA synthetase
MMSPIAPFYSDQLYRDLAEVAGQSNPDSVHLGSFPKVNKEWIDTELEARMELAQKISSMVLSLRKKEKIKVRQPLQKIMIPLRDPADENRIRQIEDLIRSEVNVKEVELIKDASDILVKKIKPNFKTIGPKYGKHMKAISGMIAKWGSEEIGMVENNGKWEGELNGEKITLDMDDFTITTQDIPGWLVAVDGNLTVALDITLNDELVQEGITRELVNRIQNLRKESGLDVTDKIDIHVQTNQVIEEALNKNLQYIKSEVLANQIYFKSDNIEDGVLFELEEGPVKISISKS